MDPKELQRLAADARPRLTWRVGISGHIELPKGTDDALNKSLARVFDDIKAGVAAIHSRPGAHQLFHDDPPVVALVCALAEGADRLAAAVGVEKGLELRAPLPFPAEEYRRDFPATVAAFDGLLKQAADKGGVVELDGETASGDPRNRAYMAVGNFTLRNCDLLVAVWNGAEARGHGGTGCVVENAQALGMPIVHIWSNGPGKIRLWGHGVWEDYSRERLAALIAAQLIPNVKGTPTKDPLRPAEIYFRKEPLKDTGAEPDFLYRGPFVPRMNFALRAVAGVFPLFVKLLGRKPKHKSPKMAPPPAGPADDATRYLFLHHHRADTLATFYANVHRSTFLLVYLMGALALSCAIAAIYFGEREVPLIGWQAMYLFTGFELAILGLLGALVLLDNHIGWRDRWLEYRLLAELLREADLLAQIGRPMPMAKIEELTQDLPGRAWVMVTYCAIVRRVGLMTRTFDKPWLARVRDYAADTRLEDQIVYHERAMHLNESIAGALRYVGWAAFAATVIAAVVKLTYHEIADQFALGLLAGVLPAFAYACFGIRNQAEFEIVSRRSERMIARLTRHKERIQALKEGALTSETLGREILKAANVMRHDAADWASIFEVKETET